MEGKQIALWEMDQKKYCKLPCHREIAFESEQWITVKWPIFKISVPNITSL